MKARIPRLPVVKLALVAGCLLLGLSLAPAGAQSVLQNGMVTIRSDGTVYLISNGMRRWVATVVIDDEELNEYPEGPPIYTALAPFGSASTAAAKPTGTSTTTRSGSSSSSSAENESDESSVDPSGRVEARNGNCPASHQIKGATDSAGEKIYYDPERPAYPSVKAEECFRAGKDARDAGYVEDKKR